MSRREVAHRILNRVRDGQGRSVPDYLIKWALRQTGDMDDKRATPPARPMAETRS